MRINKGAALITALFIMALVAIAATSMSVNLDLSIRRTQLSVTSTQLYFAAEGVQFWAEGVLQDDATKISQNKKNIDKIPQKFGPLLQNGVTITGELLDAQSRFNLNNLTEASAIPQFELLLQAAVPTMNQTEAATIADATANWVSSSTALSNANQYLEIYRKMQPPYQAAYMRMVSPSEFRLVAHVTPEIYQKLFPYIIALPIATQININTASAPIIMSLAKGISATEADTFIAARLSIGFTNFTELAQNSSYQKMHIRSSKVTLSSQYFLAVATASTNDQRLVLYSLISRQRIKHVWQTSVLWQTEGDY